MMTKRCAEFEKSEVLVRDTVRITVTRKNSKPYKLNQGKVSLEKGKVGNETAYRLVLCRANVLFGVFRSQSIHLNKDTFCAAVYDSDCRKVIYSLTYCPTLTIVAVDCSVVLTFIDYNEAKRKRKFEMWSDVIRRELKFSGYWSARKVSLDDQNIGTPEEAALLCVTDFRLSISTRDERGIYMSQLSFDIRKMESSQRHTEYSKGEVRLEITFIDGNRSERLTFNLNNDHGMTRDLFSILDKIKAPVSLEVDNTTRQSSVPIRRRGNAGRCEPHKRISRDDLDLLPLVPRKYACQNRRVPIQEYDLNAISSESSVQNALHFYENLQWFRDRNPPDVVINRPSPVETEEYWSIVNTLTAILRKRKPWPDTLNVPPKLRMKLCFLLLDTSLQSWKELAEYIGLTQDSVRMTETLFQSGMELNPINASEVLTPPECIFRHWQFVHNQHSQGLQTGAPPFPCSLPSLIEILNTMERYDLVSLLQQQQQQQQLPQRQQCCLSCVHVPITSYDCRFRSMPRIT